MTRCALRLAVLVILASEVSCVRNEAPSIEVTSAGDLQPGATRFTVTASGEIWRDGVKTTAAELPEAKPKQRGVLDPKLIVADGALTTGDLVPLLEALISTGGCLNVSFLVTSKGREGELALPVESEHCCGCLKFDAGTFHYNEHGTNDWSHLWISARPEPLTITGMQAEPLDSIYFPDADEDPAPKEPPPKPAWSAEKMPEGTLTADVLKAFFDRELIRAARPVVVLDVPPETRVSDLLRDMATLRESGVLYLVWIRPRR